MGTAVGAVGTAGAPCILGTRTAVVTLCVGGIVASLGAGLTYGIYRRARAAVGAVGTAGAPCILGSRTAVVARSVGVIVASIGAKCSLSGGLLKGVAPGGTRRKSVIYCIVP